MVFFPFLLSLLFSLSLFGQGFVAGTLVKTPYGYSTIEKLRPGNTVISYDLKGSCLECPITHISQKYTESVIELTIGSEKLYVAPDHAFYLPLEKQWREAQLLKQRDILLKSCTELIILDAIDVHHQETVVFDLTIDQYHNFCVSHNDITVHNDAVVLTIFTYVFGEGIAWFAGAAGTLGAALFYKGIQKIARDAGADVNFDDIDGKNYADFPTSLNAGNYPNNDDDDDYRTNKWAKTNSFYGKSDNPATISERNNLHKQTRKELIKSKNSFEKLIKEHEQKLKNYQINPDAYDNKGFLKNAPNPAAREKIIRTRAQELQRQIKKQKSELAKVSKLLEQAGA